MGSYFPKGVSGRQYGFQIEGDQPTDYERQWAEQYIASQGDALLPDEPLVGDGSDSNALVRGFSRGIDTLQLGLGSALEGAGTVTGFDWLKEFGADVVETNKQQLAEQEEYATRLEDVQDVGTGLSFFGETLGEQAPQLGATIAGSVVGAKTGAAIGTAIVPGIGTVIGTAIGTVAGGLAANLPFFYGMNREAQKDTLKEGEVVDEGVAALTAIPQAATDYIADRIVVGRLLTPKLINGGGIFTRGVKGVGTGAAIEAPTEVGQQILERMQAGKDITSQEAIDEYIEVAVAAGLVGGTVRGTTNVIGGDPIKKEAAAAQAELDEDQSIEANQVVTAAARGTNAVNQIQEDPTVKEAVVQQRLSTEGSQLKQKREQEKTRSGLKPVKLNTLSDEDQMKIRLNRQGLGVPQTDTVTVAELNDYGMASLGETIMREQLGAANSQATDKAAAKKPFTQEQYDTAVEAAKKSGNASINSIAMALKKKGEKKNTALAQAILEEMTANRVVRTDDGIRFTPLTEEEVAADPAVALRSELDAAKKRLEDIRATHQQAKEAEKKLMDGWQATPDQEQNLTQIKQTLDQAKASERTAEAKVRDIQRQVDAIDSRTGAAGQLSQQTTSTEAANLALRAAREAEKAQFRKEYLANKEKIRKALRKYLTGLGLKDVAMKIDSLVEPDLYKQGAIVEGYYGHAKKIIALSLDIFDPNLTTDEQMQKMKAVMNHEVIHALRDMGLFTDAEYKTLVDAAQKRKYTILRDGKNVERKYTFIDRALRMNPVQEGESAEAHQARVEEEAVAEMFRSYADGRLKLAGKPLSLFKRIINFFKGIKQAHSETGFEAADAVFDNIISGKVGERQRGIQKGRVQRRVAPEPVQADASEEAKSFSYTRIFPDNLSKFDGTILSREEAMEVQNFPQNVVDKFLGVNKLTTEPDIKEGTEVTIRLNLNGRTFIGPQAQEYKENYNKMVSDINRLPISAVEKDGMKNRIVPELNEKFAGTISTAVQTAHKGNRPNNPAVAYDTAFTVKNATFPVNQNARANISTGMQNKFPMAGVTGNVTHGGNRTEGVEVKFNPFKHHVFVASFPMADGSVVEVPIKSAEEATVYGNTVYVRGQLEFYEETDPDFPQVMTEITGTDKKSGEQVTRTPPPVQYSFSIPEEYDGSTRSYSTIRLDPARIKPTKESTDRMQRKSGLGLPKSVYATTMLHRIDNDDNFIEVSAETLDGRPEKMRVVQALRMLQDERGDFILDASNPKDLKRIAEIMAAEAEVALRRDGNAIGWYEAKLQAAKEIIHAMQLAEGRNMTILDDPDMEAAFDFALAITSNGISVNENFGYAIRQLDNWIETGEFIEQGFGKRQEAMTKAFQFYNALKRGSDNRKPMDDFEIAEYLSGKITVSQLKADPLIKELGITVPAGESQGLEVPRAYLLGPKIGMGFYMNLRGDFDNLTMDMWWMRMWNRMTGRPFKVFTEEKKLENINEFRAEIANALSAEPVMEVTKGKTTRPTFSDTDMKIYQAVIEDLGIQPDTDQNAVDIAIEFQNRFQKLYADIGDRNTDKVKAYAKERGLNWKDKAVKEATPDQEALPPKTTFALSTERVFEKFAAEVEQASPRGPKERQQMRDAANMAREILSDRLGVDINMADFQALMWYPEKQLLASMNVQQGLGSDNDYVDGAISIAKERGLTDADISEALPDSERGRLSPVRRDRDEPISGLTPTNQSAKADALEAGVFKRADTLGQDEGKSYSVVNGADGYKKLQNLINENPDGFTAYTDTFRSVLEANDFAALREAGEIEGAFVVAPVKTAEIIIGKELPLSLLQQYIGNAKNLSKTTGQRVYLGGWFNSDDGQYYLDNVLMSFNRQDALYIAQGSDQIAIFDLSRFEEVNTNEGIEQLKEAGTYSDNRADRFRRSLNTVGRVFEEGRIQYSRRLEQDAETTAERVDELVSFTEEDFPFTDYLKGEQDAAARELSGLLDRLPTNDKSYSLIGRPLAKHLNPVAQRKADRGEPLPKNPYLYGVTKARDGKFYGIILQDGQDVEGVDPEDRPVKGIGSFGLDHIMKRDHHNEIVNNSRWPNVQQAAYDMLRVWSNQNGESGAEIVDFPDGGMGNMDLRLEWAKPSHKSPKLIMSLKFARDASTGSGFYTIRTMYPDMKDKRSRSMVTFSPVAAGSLPMRVQEAERGFMYSSSYNVLKKVIGLGGLVSDKKAEDATMTFLTKLQDRMLPVGRMIDQLRAMGVNITDSMDTYLKESIFHGVVADRINTANRTMYEPVAETLKRLNIDGRWNALISTGAFASQTFEQNNSKKLTAVEAYLYALHAKERNEYIRSINPQMDSGSGMSDAEADRIISWANSLDAENRAVLEDVSRQVRNIVNDTNKIRIDGGLIPEDFDDGEPVYATEADMNAEAEENSVSAPDFQNYVPLRGILDPLGEASEEGSFRGAGGYGFTVRGKEDLAALGRTTYGVNILAGVFLQHQNSIVRAEKNAVANSFLDLIEANPEATANIAEVADTRPMKRGIVNGTVRLVPDMNALNDPNILIAKRDGKDIYIRIFDDRIAQAMKGSTGNSPTTNNIVLKGMTNLNRWLSTINTSYNPEFIITNLFRDLQTAGVNINQYEKDRLTREVMGNIKSSYKGLKETIRKGQTSGITKEDALRPDFDISAASDADVYRLFQLFGGQNSLNMMSGLQDQVNQINKVVGELSEAGAKGQVNKLKNSLVGRGAGSLLNAIEDYNTIAENLVRVATFKALAPKIGYEKAAFAARNVTVDFAKGGELKTLMNGMYLFYNASLQGTFAMLNAATRSPRVRKLWASVVVSGLILDQMNALFSDEDEDGELIYDKIPQYVLEHNIILPDVFNVTDRSFITIPMPYGLNMAFNAGRAMSRAQRGKYTAGEATANIIGVTLDTLNPLGGNIGYMIEGAAKGDADFTEALNVLMPTIADPAIEVARNVDFTGGPIVKEQSRFDPTPPPKSQLYWNSTNDTFKSIASTLNELTGGSELESGFIDFQPEIYEFWTNFFTGGAGMFAVRAKNFMTETVPTAMTEGLSDEMVRSIPFGRKMTYSVSEREDMGQFIENRNQILKAQELLEAALRAGDPSAARDVRQRFPNELRIAGQVKALNNARNRLLRRIKQVEANPRMPDAQKEKIIDNMKEQLSEVVKRANILMNKVL